MDNRYDRDFYSWGLAQADALRRRSANEIDWDNLAEEVEALSRSEARELAARYAVLLCHLIKWMMQPERRSRSWRNTIEEQRDAILQHLAENPGLKSQEAERFQQGWRSGRRTASTEMDVDLDAIPADPPFTMEQSKAAGWWPPETPPEA